MVRFSVSLFRDEAEAVERAANRERVSKSEIIRRLIRAGLMTHPGVCKNLARGVDNRDMPSYNLRKMETDTRTAHHPHTITSVMLLARRRIEECPMWLRNLRLRAGWTQRQLADAVGVQQPNISQYENGVHVPDAVTSFLMIEMLEAAAGDNDGDVADGQDDSTRTR